MKPEKQNLIHDLLDEDLSRRAILSAGSRVLRRRRQWRAAKQVVVVAGLIAAVSVFYLKRETPRLSLTAVSSKEVKAVGPQIHALTDDELLSLFTNTPVGLVSLADGKKKLIFPRPGDEQKFITRF